MGFPKPISGMTEQTDNGLIRQVYWQRGIHFQEKSLSLMHQRSWLGLMFLIRNPFPKDL